MWSIDDQCRVPDGLPADLLEIQVLDDSTDETRSIAEFAVRPQPPRGSTSRTCIGRIGPDTKGALEEGMKVAKGEFFAIFDADFIPSRDFIHRTIHHFVDPKVGVVQARWGHINADYSLLTKIQSMLLDAHFVLEHGGRNRAGHFFNFNGTAGIWRRAAILDGGGWQHDTLTEDLDLSYRAQLRGWKFHFLPDLVVPAELPVEMNAFKTQQHRWAKGSIQTCRKLLPLILQSDQPFGVKAEAFFHLTANFNYVLMVLLSILIFPSMVIRYNMGWSEMLLIDVPLFLAATASVANFYVVCQRELYPAEWVTRLKYLPFLMSIGIGLAINNARAVFEALTNTQTEFARTPKYPSKTAPTSGSASAIARGTSFSRSSSFRLASISLHPVLCLSNRIYGTLPFLMLFQVGFLYTGLLSIVQQFADDSVALKTQIAGGGGDQPTSPQLWRRSFAPSASTVAAGFSPA